MKDFFSCFFKRDRLSYAFRQIIIAGLLLYVMFMTISFPAFTAYAEVMNEESNVIIADTIEDIEDNSVASDSNQIDYSSLISDTSEEDEAEDEDLDATETSEEDTSITDYTNSWDEDYTHDAKVLYEDVSKRETNAKHFLMDDGSYTVVQYSDDIHYKVNGKYEEIDNTLIKTADNVLENTANSFKVRMPETYDTDAKTSVSIDEYYLSFKLSGYNSLADKKAVLTNEISRQTLDADDSFQFSLRNDSGIAYDFAQNNIQLEYRVVGSSLKENIIINEKMSSYVFEFEMQVTNLTLVLDESGNINANNYDGATVFVIPAGYMFDANNAYSDSVKYELNQTESGYTLKVIPDSDWIDNKDRAFPITVDPVIQLTNSSILMDSRITVPVGDEYPYDNTLPISYYNISFMKFANLPSLPSGATVVDAQLYFTTYNPASTDQLLFIYECEKEWCVAPIPTNFTFDTNSNLLPDQQKLILTNPIISSYNIDITRNVKNWIEYNKTQYGFAFKSMTSAENIWIFKANSTVSYRPYLEINYRVNVGLESYWDYDTFEVGTSDLYVNKYNNQLTVVNDDITTGGEFPIALQHVYLSAYKDQNYNIDGIYDNVNYGYGWKLNYQQILRYNTDQTVSYYDADGTLHLFKSSGDWQWTDEDGIGLNLSYTNSIYTMTDKNENKYKFDYHGRLYRIEDKNGNITNIVIGDGNSPTVEDLPITQINDGNGRAVYFAYNSSGYLNTITYKKLDGVTNATMSFTYVNNCLTNITYDDGTYINYLYSSTNSITFIGDENNNGVVLQSLTLTINTTTDGKTLNDTYNGIRIKESFYNSTTQNFIYRSRLENLYLNGITISVTAKEGEGFTEFSAASPISYFDNNLVIDSVYDTYGRLISSYIAGPEITTTVARRFTETEDNGINNNKITATTSYESNVINYLKNYNFESNTSYWSKTIIGTQVYTNIASSDKYSYIGSKALELFVSQPAVTELKAQQTTVTLSAGSYILSAYIRVFDTLMFYSGYGSNYGAYIGVNTGDKSDYLTNDLFTTNNGFKLYSIRFILTSSQTVTVYAALKNCSGFAYFDGIQLVKDDYGYTDKYNLAENAGFELDGTTLPDNWNFWTNVTGITSANSLSVTTTNSFSGKCLRFDGPGLSGGSNLYQRVSLPQTSNTTSYTLSAWFNTLGRTMSDSLTRLNYRFLDANGAALSAFMWVDITLQSIYWYQVSTTFIVPPEVKKIEINIQMAGSYSILLIDNVSLVQSEIINYEYDSNGNTSSYESGDGTVYDYSESGQTATISKDGTTEYGVVKDASGNVITSINYNRLVKSSYTYDSYGRLLTDVFSNALNSKKISSETQYSDIDEDFQNTITDTDSLGFQTISNYYSFYDLLQRTTSNDGSYLEYTYAYDTTLTNQIKTITVTNKSALNEILATVIYTYYLSNELFYDGIYYRSMGMLKSVEMGNGTVYSYIYDKWGSTKQVLLNGSVQIQYNYSSLDGKLTSKVLANGYTEYYSYDKLGRMSQLRTQVSTTSDIITAYTWEYSVASNLIRMQDYVQNKLYEYQYDASGRLIISAEGVRTTGKMNIFYETTYDKYGDVSNVSTIVNDGTATSGMVTNSFISTSGTMTRSRSNATETISIDNVVRITYTYSSYDASTSFVIREDNSLNNSTAYPTGTRITYTRDANGKLLSSGISAINSNSNIVTSDSIYSLKTTSYNYDNNIVTTDIWSNAYALANYKRPGMPVTSEANETYNEILISNIIRMYQASFYGLDGIMYSMVDQKILVSSGDEMILHYWIRKENAGTDILNVFFVYSDGTESGASFLEDNTNWQEFTLMSVPGKTVTMIRLGWCYDSYVRIGNITLNIKNQVWSNDYVLANYKRPGMPVTMQDDETYNGIPITNIIRMYQASFYGLDGIMYSMVDPDILNNGGDEMLLHYWIRKENAGTDILNVFFVYSDGTESGASFLEDNTNWQEFTILSIPGKTVTMIRLGWCYDSYVRIGNIRLETQVLGRKDDRIVRETLINNNNIQYDYDELGRETTATIQNSKVDATNILKETYSYLDGSDNNTSYTITSKAIMAGTANGITYNYTYNMDNTALGTVKAERPNPYNIWQIYEGSTLKVQYYYDLMGRLTRENNVYANATITYTYDANNNLTSKTTYAYTTGTPSGGTVKTYTYGDTTFKDRLTGYNGSAITYDAIGNPLSYMGKTLTWFGRQLSTWTNGSSTYTFAYDSEGIRLSKILTGGTETSYLYSGSQLLREIKGIDKIWYLYDNVGMVGFELNGTSYYYVRNLQGDVTSIVNTSGTTVVTYSYDSWGKVLSVSGSLSTTVGALNPIRYRGYYYDTETNLYYLNSRYYDPETGRFLSTDVVAEGGNLYVYCQNDPINRSDESGYASTWNWSKFFTGALMLATGVAAVAISVATFGAATPLAIAAIAAVTVTAGVLTGVNGIATIVEAGTDYNFVRDGLFNEVLGASDEAYNIYAGVTEGVAIVGTAICGGWVKTHVSSGTIKPNLISKPYSKYSYITEQGLKQTRYYGKGGLPIKDIDYFHGGVGHTFPHTHYWEILGDIFKRLGGK